MKIIKKIYSSKNNSTNKAQIIKLKNNGYTAIKPLKNKFIKLHKLLASFSHIEKILKNKIDEVEIRNIDN